MKESNLLFEKTLSTKTFRKIQKMADLLLKQFAFQFHYVLGCYISS